MLKLLLKLISSLYGLDNFYYRRSNIYDAKGEGLYGLDNFYYRRCCELLSPLHTVYTDLIISTIVDVLTICLALRLSIRT